MGQGERVAREIRQSQLTGCARRETESVFTTIAVKYPYESRIVDRCQKSRVLGQSTSTAFAAGSLDVRTLRCTRFFCAAQRHSNASSNSFIVSRSSACVVCSHQTTVSWSSSHTASRVLSQAAPADVLCILTACSPAEYSFRV